MNLRRCVLLLFAVLVSLCAVPRSAPAETMVLDGDDVSDWVRVFSASSWKHHDSCLYPRALLKFDLSDLVATDILEARLYLYVERTEPGTSIELWHVEDDSWSYGLCEPDTVWRWPTWHSIGGISFTDTTSFWMDVTEHLREELQAGDREFSIKITEGLFWYPDIRISSPLAPLQRMRPRIVVEFLGPPSLPPPLPDLAVSTADLRMSPARPEPGETVTLEAAVRNIGAMDAWNVPVAFWDGPPEAADLPIGIWIVPFLAAGGGTDVAEVQWVSERGLHDIYAVVDFENTIGETDETNNEDFRSFLITDADAYVNGLESFEYPGLRDWQTDSDVPKQFTYPGPKSFYVTRSGAEAYHGDFSMEMFLDGTADDGTIWIERAVPVDPHSLVDVNVDFELFRYYPDIAFEPVVSVSLLDPEVERDFYILPIGAQEGWLLHPYHRTLESGPYDRVYIAVGTTVTWETPGTLFLDLVRTQVTQVPTSVGPSPAPQAPDAHLFQNRPNPMGTLTTIAYRLPAEGPVTLSIYDVTGRRVTTLTERTEAAGWHEVHWDGTDSNGDPVASGVYVYRLKTREGEENRKLLLVR